MARRISASQARSQLRQAQQRQRQAVNKYNADVRKYNANVKRAVDNYNRDVRAHNSKVRSNRQRLQREIARLNSSSRTTTTRFVVYRQAVVSLQQSYSRVESSPALIDDEIIDLAEGETANSVAVLNALLTDEESTSGDADALRASSISTELSQIDSDLDARWRGALFALSPDNPDAARHFCTSARELLTTILETEAPDQDVMERLTDYDTTSDGGVSRRSRIRYCLVRKGMEGSELEAFVEEDINNVIALFREFNSGTHGSAGRFSITQLVAIKRRVEDAIRFLHRILR